MGLQVALGKLREKMERRGGKVKRKALERRTEGKGRREDIRMMTWREAQKALMRRNIALLYNLISIR